ncbi:MAG: valine--tRNA ligase [Candidatus Pacebacteria bacterium]|nr:valine--tRNA ligase [Candidatus Paceibacterota bacterium]
MNEKYLQPYNAENVEDAISKIWEESGFYNPDEMIKAGLTDPNAEAFSIVLPPPNVTGTLHTGHASMLAIQDIMVRYHRMLGKRTLWLPGTDHAAIATQSKVEKLLQKEKIRKHDLGRKAFLERVNTFAQDSHDTIVSQCKKMGASLDWSREAFTLDKEREHAVYTAFTQMYNDGLIYQKERIVNWDPKGQTTISDDEVVRENRKGTMYTFKYSHDFPFPIATTRPETKLGDTAVAVHPEDKRYQEYIGNEYSFNFAGEDVTVKIVADEHVDPEFGVGALGVTPAHSVADWDIAQRHNLPLKQVINEYGKMIVGMEGVKDVKVAAAREAVVEWLKSEGLLLVKEDTIQSVGTAERTGAVIEPLPKLQWWIDVNKKFPAKDSKIEDIEKGQMVSLKELMLHVVRNEQIDILPSRFEKTYFNWIENLRDWNISRQIWYGHRIPVWYKGDDIFVGTEAPSGDDWKQDEDTLDTWFSSGLWTFSTLGWPNTESDDFKTYHPTNILETGHDIIFFWVARMILMTTYLLGDIPFETVYLHGLVRDAKGRKMSKSLGNIIDPVDLIGKYGTDALRMALIVGNGPGGDVNLDENKIKAYSKFGNKLWNITRFVLTETESINLDKDFEYSLRDQELIKEQEELFQELTKEMNEFKYYLVSEKLYHYTWDTFASEILEESKTIFENGSTEEIHSRRQFLLHSLKMIVTMLHPFMPFITEEIWKDLKNNDDRDILMTVSWPTL